MQRPPNAFRLTLVLTVLAACSKGGSDPAPLVPTPPPNTPAIPTVANPGDQLPSQTGMLTTDSALLSNFSPDIDSAPFIDTVKDLGLHTTIANPNATIHLVDLQLAPGRQFLVRDGKPCHPDRMQWRPMSFGSWNDVVESDQPPCFVHLLDFAGSHYYVSLQPALWPVGDLNCRLAGWDLASITSQAEHDAVFAALTAWSAGTDAYIGLTDWPDEGIWNWRSGEPFAWDNWAPNEPNNYGPGEDFVHFYDRDLLGRWNDTTGAPKHYVFETDQPFQEETEPSVPAHFVDTSPLYLRDYGLVTELPRVERRVYWQKVFQTTIEAGASYSEEHSYASGTNESTGTSFGWSIGVSASLGWGPASVEIESEFHQDFNRQIDVWSESQVTKTYSFTAPQGKKVVFALWQLRERFEICDANGDPWQDPQYILAGALPVLEQGLREEYVQTIYFDAP